MQRTSLKCTAKVLKSEDFAERLLLFSYIRTCNKRSFTEFVTEFAPSKSHSAFIAHIQVAKMCSGSIFLMLNKSVFTYNSKHNKTSSNGEHGGNS